MAPLEAVAMRTEQKEQNLLSLPVSREAGRVEKGGLVERSTNMAWISSTKMLPGQLQPCPSAE